MDWRLKQNLYQVIVQGWCRFASRKATAAHYVQSLLWQPARATALTNAVTSWNRNFRRAIAQGSFSRNLTPPRSDAQFYWAKQDPPTPLLVQPPPWGPGTSEALALHYPCP